MSNTRTLIRAALSLLALGMVAVLFTAGPAHAATGKVRDEAGDAPKTIDITSFRATYGTRSIQTAISVKNLTGKGAFAVAWTDGSTTSYGVRLQKNRAALVSVDITDGSVKELACRGLKANRNTKRDVVSFTVPKKCAKKTPASWTFEAVAALPGGKFDTTKALTVKRG